MSYTTDELFKRMSRKPFNYDDAENMAPYTKEERAFLAKLQVFKPKELFTGKMHFFNLFKIQVPLWFILHHNNAYYLVDTEGYQYIRYIGKLNNI